MRIAFQYYHWLLFFGICLCAQYIIPQLNDGKDILFITDWKLFSLPESVVVYDVLCLPQKGNPFYIYQKMGRKADDLRLDIGFVEMYLNDEEKEYPLSKEQLKVQIQKMCIGELELVSLQTSYFKHFVLQEESKILKRMPF